MKIHVTLVTVGIAHSETPGAHDELLVHKAVSGELSVEQRFLLGVRQLAVEEQVCGVVKVPALGQLLDVILRRRKGALVCVARLCRCLPPSGKASEREARTPRYSRTPFRPSI